jgi:hypothetical protein
VGIRTGCWSTRLDLDEIQTLVDFLSLSSVRFGGRCMQTEDRGGIRLYTLCYIQGSGQIADQTDIHGYGSDWIGLGNI